MFKQFQNTLVMNYIWGSGIAVFGVGGLFIFQTLDLSKTEMLILLVIMGLSGMIMIWLELLLYRRHIRPIRHVFQTEIPTYEALQQAFNQTSHFPTLTVKRILGPHLFGLSVPAMSMTALAIERGWIDLPYRLIGLAAFGAILIAILHALIEFFLTYRSVEPLLLHLQETSESSYGRPLQATYRSISVRTKLLISMLVIGVFPVALFILASGVQLSTVNQVDAYWQWAALILVVIIGVATFSSFLLYDNIKRPISALTEGVAALDAGKLNPIDNPYSDEFAQLVTGFNQMVTNVTHRDAENEQLLNSLFVLFAATLDARDSYTAGHSERVAAYSVELAQALQLPNEQIELLRKSALLHDIGKIGIRDDVLLKEGRLTDHEFAQIQEHPTIGIHILNQISLPATLQPILAGVRSHHERMDGRGYPDRLVGEAIPLFGRIMAIADAYDAMTSNRPYRDGMPVEKALSILESGRGTQWDAAFVDVFVQLRREAISA
ncbi:HD domain-containing protein [Exiguobacterium sp. SL-10]|uniref:HD domain-containing phosphohydrolase n=1 Tax=Exiguobacterium sp. SL-10 TaxID=2510962 RepID=UPI00103D9A54|nr:HD domain-containing phosphohydrolase [Exiguobacterium sp. SL-10]TCI31136.1 HD domain-containing protein [Exiguobacterium sp. SL-10]